MPDTTIDTGTTELLASLESGVLTLTLNRPEARNAMTSAMIEGLQTQLARAETDPQVRCVVLTGAGKGFCSGGDVKGMADGEAAGRTMDQAIHLQRLAQRETAGRLFRMPKPTLAVVNGAAAGAGLALALACDLRLMSRSAFFMTAFARVGLSGDFGGSWFLSRLVGPAKARELYYLSDRVEPAEAERLGLTNWVCDPVDLEAQARATAARLAAGAGVAFRYMKENLNRALVGDLEDCMDVEATHHVHCTLTEDHRAAVAAFASKAEPSFTGR